MFKLEMASPSPQAPKCTLRCDDCSVALTPAVLEETVRVGQVAFTITTPVHVCESCGDTHMRGVTLNVTDAMKLTRKLIGLPPYGDPEWTAEVESEAHLRKKAPPAVTVKVTYQTPVEAIMQQVRSGLGMSS